MGEYATYHGEEIKIGTGKDMFYLRADQSHKIHGYQFEGSERFRFPWPDEDNDAPGSFERYERSCPLVGLNAPAELATKHNSVQFVAQAGYLTSLPCPERFAASCGVDAIDVNGLRVMRNGFAGRVLLCQQRFFEGRLVGIARCGGCGLKWRLSLEEAIAAAESLREEARSRRGSEAWYLAVASRLLAGYPQESEVKA